MIGAHQSPAERAQAEASWLALLSGADACADLDDEPETDPECDCCGKPSDELDEQWQCPECVEDGRLEREHQRIESASWRFL